MVSRQDYGAIAGVMNTPATVARARCRSARRVVVSQQLLTILCWSRCWSARWCWRRGSGLRRDWREGWVETHPGASLFQMAVNLRLPSGLSAGKVQDALEAISGEIMMDVAVAKPFSLTIPNTRPNRILRSNRRGPRT